MNRKNIAVAGETKPGVKKVASSLRYYRSFKDTSYQPRPQSKVAALQAVGQELIRKGRRILFITCEMLVQELLIAKRDLKLSKLIKKYARYEAMIIDDLGSSGKHARRWRWSPPFWQNVMSAEASC